MKRVLCLYRVSTKKQLDPSSDKTKADIPLQRKACKEFIIAVSGSFHVTLDDGENRQTYLLNHPYQGLLVETDSWRTLDDFSSGSV